MAPARRAQLINSVPAPGPRRERVSQQHYVAEIVSPGALRRFVHAVGGGDRAVAWIAGRQLGLVTSRQLQAAGWGRGMIARRARDGRLRRLHRGVYLVGHPVPLPGALELAAVLACGGGALVSHRSAAQLWGLTKVAELTEISVIGRHCVHAGIRVHRVANLDPRDRALKNGIPITSPARSIIDFAAGSPPDELEWALAEARARRLLTDDDLRAALARAGSRAGVGAVRAAMRTERGPRLTRSEAERRLLRLIRAAGLPEPVTNARVAGIEVDFVWPDMRVVVEVDGFAFHGHRSAFERDRWRDMALRDAGFEVVRMTWRALVDEPLRVIVHLARALARRGWGYNSSASSP
jgi:very-short-patch-repair endonuclease